jgi:hypothetical protein
LCMRDIASPRRQDHRPMCGGKDRPLAGLIAAWNYVIRTDFSGCAQQEEANASRQIKASKVSE